MFFIVTNMETITTQEKLEWQKNLTSLKRLGLELKDILFQLPGSAAKERLIAETLVLDNLTNADFCDLQKEVAAITNMAILEREWFGKEPVKRILKVLENISAKIKEIIT